MQPGVCLIGTRAMNGLFDLVRIMGDGLDQVINPFVLYGLIALGALGVCLALPRKGMTPQILGAILGGLAAGLLFLFMGLKAGKQIPNIYFYIFSLIGVGSALRVITHPRPVYAALYFVMTVIASGGLFLLLSAEFMAFALIIVYAGAILITYLFVIMLATQAPEEGEIEVLQEYDTSAREPIAATVVGFVLLAVLTTFAFRGVTQLPTPPATSPNALLAEMPRKVERVLKDNGKLETGETARYDAAQGVVVVTGADGKTTRSLTKDQWPEEMTVNNSELLGFNLLRDHPGTIEIAGVILLMAMLGAVVLSRKQVELDEDAKARRSQALATATGPTTQMGEASPLETGPRATEGGA